MREKENVLFLEGEEVIWRTDLKRQNEIALLKRLQTNHGLGPFTIEKTEEVPENAKADVAHNQWVYLANIPGKFSGHWFKPKKGDK
jgi:hypothetical protein